MAEETAAAQTSGVQNGDISDLQREQQISDSPPQYHRCFLGEMATGHIDRRTR